MPGPRHRRLVDQEVVHEQLSADVDRHDRGRVTEIRGNQRVVVRVLEPGRPGRAERDAVVQNLWRRRGGRDLAGAERQQDGARHGAAKERSSGYQGIGAEVVRTLLYYTRAVSSRRVKNKTAPKAANSSPSTSP